ncbi:hypothetical protein O980_24245, partial [Mycobacterium avium subsp. paratuberculosis 08-8281]
TPSTHQPPSRARPSTAGASSSRRAQPANSSAVTCGVSIPICSTGNPSAASACALASRAPKSLPRWAITVNDASRALISAPRAAPSRSPVSATTRAATGAAATASSVSSRAAAAISAAARSPTAAASRVLARPGSGALATTSRVTGITKSPSRSRGSR